MFRSWGEFHRCAKDVFHIFAEPLPDSQQSDAISQHSVPLSLKSASVARKLGLGRAGLECAFYVLFGRYPSPTLIKGIFSFVGSPGTCNDLLATHKADGEKQIALDEFLRFITLCAEEEGPGLVAGRTQERDAPPYELRDNEVLNLKSETARARQMQCWRLFESVAGAKGYITFADVRTIPAQHPFQDVVAVLEHSRSTAALFPSTRHRYAAESASESSRRQEALTRHVFWIMDSDHDGKVCFGDVKPYLLGV